MDQPNMQPQTPPSGGNQKVMWIVAAVIVIGLIAWLAMSKKPAGEGEMNQTKAGDQTSPAPQAMSNQMSMKELMASGKSQKCTVESSTANSQSQGTIYFGNGKMRGDFTSTASGKTFVSHMINDGTTVYTWTDGMSMAVKMSVSAMDSMTTKPASTQNPQAVDPDAKYDYKCSGWSVDNSVFALPAGINFTDMSAMMNTGASAGASGSSNAAACASCDKAGEGKAQCLAMLKCN